ncbi:MAG: CcdB family protein [Sulfuriferula sp.]|nr:CcdB family protein [Sulfuriferula sp.]
MAQFSVYRNKDKGTQAHTPLLLDVQSDLIIDLTTRVVIPLRLVTTLNGKVMQTLIPLCEIENSIYAAMTPQLAGISIKQLGEKVADLSQQRDDIIAALDLLLTGI